MKKLIAIAVAILALLPLPAYAHRLDELLQATILSIDTSRVDGSMRLVPGVAVSATVIGSIDKDRDGVLSNAEQNAYAQRVLNDLLLKVDDQPLTIHLVSAHFPAIDQIEQGIGETQLEFTANLPRGAVNRTLIFENHHQPNMAVYLVNSLIPQDKDIHLGEQVRNVNQSSYQVSFVQGAGASQKTSPPNFSGFAGAFRLGVRHIAGGTDHLMFLLTLLLPASLLACAGRWDQPATVKRGLIQSLSIVTASRWGIR